MYMDMDILIVLVVIMIIMGSAVYLTLTPTSYSKQIPEKNSNTITNVNESTNENPEFNVSEKNNNNVNNKTSPENVLYINNQIKITSISKKLLFKFDSFKINLKRYFVIIPDKPTYKVNISTEVGKVIEKNGIYFIEYEKPTSDEINVIINDVYEFHIYLENFNPEKLNINTEITKNNGNPEIIITIDKSYLGNLTTLDIKTKDNISTEVYKQIDETFNKVRFMIDIIPKSQYVSSVTLYTMIEFNIDSDKILKIIKTDLSSNNNNNNVKNKYRGVTIIVNGTYYTTLNSSISGKPYYDYQIVTTVNPKEKLNYDLNLLVIKIDNNPLNINNNIVSITPRNDPINVTIYDINGRIKEKTTISITKLINEIEKSPVVIDIRDKDIKSTIFTVKVGSTKEKDIIKINEPFLIEDGDEFIVFEIPEEFNHKVLTNTINIEEPHMKISNNKYATIIGNIHITINYYVMNNELFKVKVPTITMIEPTELEVYYKVHVIDTGQEMSFVTFITDNISDITFVQNYGRSYPLVGGFSIGYIQITPDLDVPVSEVSKNLLNTITKDTYDYNLHLDVNVDNNELIMKVTPDTNIMVIVLTKNIPSDITKIPNLISYGKNYFILRLQKDVTTTITTSINTDKILFVKDSGLIPVITNGLLYPNNIVLYEISF